MATITLEVPDDIARAYDTASIEEREKLELWVQLFLKDVQRRDPRTLKELMDEMGRQAAENGLTPEILEEILRDDE